MTHIHHKQTNLSRKVCIIKKYFQIILKIFNQGTIKMRGLVTDITTDSDYSHSVVFRDYFNDCLL